MSKKKKTVISNEKLMRNEGDELMSKRNNQRAKAQACNSQCDTVHGDTDHGRGVIRDNALKAVVTSVVFRTRVTKAKKGKGSFQRKGKHAGRESYSMAA